MPVFMKESNLQRNSEKTRKLISRLLLFFVMVGVGIWILFQFLVTTNIIPEKYHNVTYILPILLVSQIFMAITALLNNYLIYFEKTYVLLVSGIFISLVSIGLSIYFIPGLGIYGAAYAVLISNILYLLVCYYLVRVYKNKFLQTAVLPDVAVSAISEEA
jgi:O-antigen/teichoic acid export membrane protein